MSIALSIFSDFYVTILNIIINIIKIENDWDQQNLKSRDALSTQIVETRDMINLEYLRLRNEYIGKLYGSSDEIAVGKEYLFTNKSGSVISLVTVVAKEPLSNRFTVCDVSANNKTLYHIPSDCLRPNVNDFPSASDLNCGFKKCYKINGDFIDGALDRP